MSSQNTCPTRSTRSVWTTSWPSPMIMMRRSRERRSVVVLFLGARFDEYGMNGLCGYPGMLGWSSSDVIRTKSGQPVKDGVAIYSFQAHAGTLFHDIAHILGGTKEGKRRVPCLCDHDLQAKPGPARKTFVDAIINVGFWDPMSCHYYRWESPPPGISSWTKLSTPFHKYGCIRAPLHPLQLRCAPCAVLLRVRLSRAPRWRGASTLSVRHRIYEAEYLGWDGSTRRKSGSFSRAKRPKCCSLRWKTAGEGKPHFRRSDSRRLVSVKK